MSTTELISNIVGISAMAGLFITLVGSTILFYLLGKKYPAYYEKNGQPISLAIALHAGTTELLARQTKGIGYILSLIGKGLPATFPHDTRLRKLAITIRWTYGYALIVFPLLFVLTFISFAHQH